MPITPLEIGDKAPAFRGTDQNGGKHALSQYLGRWVVLYFYPADDTPTCTVQACNLRDHHGSLERKGVVVLGVSPDTESSHRDFSKKFNLPFPLLADPAHRIIDSYGVWGEKTLYGKRFQGLHRTTFLIDPKGRIQKIFHRPKNKEHAKEILEALGKEA